MTAREVGQTSMQKHGGCKMHAAICCHARLMKDHNMVCFLCLCSHLSRAFPLPTLRQSGSNIAPITTALKHTLEVIRITGFTYALSKCHCPLNLAAEDVAPRGLQGPYC